jgi:hypothetical protein
LELGFRGGGYFAFLAAAVALCCSDVFPVRRSGNARLIYTFSEFGSCVVWKSRFWRSLGREAGELLWHEEWIPP